MKKKRVINCVLVGLCLCMLYVTDTFKIVSVKAAHEEEIQSRAHSATLCVYYEEWYDKHGACVIKNRQYQTFNIINGYIETPKRTSLQLTPMEYEFYDRAVKVEVSYRFY